MAPAGPEQPPQYTADPRPGVLTAATPHLLQGPLSLPLGLRLPLDQPLDPAASSLSLCSSHSPRAPGGPWPALPMGSSMAPMRHRAKGCKPQARPSRGLRHPARSGSSGVTPQSPRPLARLRAPALPAPSLPRTPPASHSLTAPPPGLSNTLHAFHCALLSWPITAPTLGLWGPEPPLGVDRGPGAQPPASVPRPAMPQVHRPAHRQVLPEAL